MSAEAGKPLPSATPADDAAEEAEEQEIEAEIDDEEAHPRPPPPGFKFSTFLYTFLFLLGILMIFDQSTRYGVAIALDHVLSPLIGFGGTYPLLTMFLAAAVEMLLTAVAYNYTTDWVKAAKVQKWSAAFRKVQMAALRSGKKDRIDALQKHQATLAKLSTEVSFAQLKGMAITWFLVIALYTWVYLFLAAPPAFHPAVVAICSSPTSSPAAACTKALVPIGGSNLNLLGPLIGPLQVWFLVFSVYTVPLSLVFRRLFKHYSLRKYAESSATPPPSPQGGVRETA
ncbi:MAG TPA: EMC3/TMCO1 family protein [Thermoplasmata archaeon]|nr:EMC3/TMCO1 family protein [Thermoplasmata archaeon]